MCSCLVLLFFLLNPFRRTKDMVEKEPLYVSSKVKKKKKPSGEKWVNNIQRVGAEMENQICTDPKLCECYLLSVLSDSFIEFPPYFCFAGCNMLGTVIHPGKGPVLLPTLCSISNTARTMSVLLISSCCLFNKVTARDVQEFCRLHVPPFSTSPWKTFELRKGYMESIILLSGKTFRVVR